MKLLKSGKAKLILLILIGCSVYAYGYHLQHLKDSVAVNTMPPASVQCSPDASVLLADINSERSKLGSPALVIDSSLVNSANQKLQDEITNAYYGHELTDGRDPSTFIRNNGVNAAWSEDLDINALTPSLDWQSFKNSPAHYASLTDATYTRVGIAERCTNYVVKQGTGTDDNSALVGKTAQELTVVNLAGPEPVVQAAPKQYNAYAPAYTTECFPAVSGVPATCYTR